jgi:hypothetical protein
MTDVRGHLVTQNGRTWVCIRCHEMPEHPSDFATFDCPKPEWDEA